MEWGDTNREDEMNKDIAGFKTDDALTEARKAIKDIIDIFSDTHCGHWCANCDKAIKCECGLIGKIDTYLRNC